MFDFTGDVGNSTGATGDFTGAAADCTGAAGDSTGKEPSTELCEPPVVVFALLKQSSNSLNNF